MSVYVKVKVIICQSKSQFMTELVSLCQSLMSIYVRAIDIKVYVS